MKIIKRTFILGEEWLYYKIYCGSYSVDTILIESILPIVSELQQKKLIDQWFFIRYNDPKNHLRVRFHLPNVDKIQEIIQLIHPYFSSLIEKDIVYDIKTAIYKREIERYGETSIVAVEKLFFHHSERTLQLIDNTTPEYDEISRIFASLQMIALLLNNFQLSFSQKQKFVLTMQMRFKEEHHIEKENNKKLDLLYRKHRNEISSFLTEKQEPLYLKGVNKILKSRKEETKIATIVLNTVNDTTFLLDIIASLIHMNINRTFRSKQRHYEMLCYDFMNRYYKSITYYK